MGILDNIRSLEENLIQEPTPEEIQQFLNDQANGENLKPFQYVSHEVEDISDYDIEGNPSKGNQIKLIKIDLRNPNDENPSEVQTWEYAYDGNEWKLWTN